MLVVYSSKTGNVQKFVDKIDVKNIKIDGSNAVEEPYVLITYTTGFGQVPVEVQEFLERGDNASYLRAVVASGNMNWGKKYGLAGDIISEKYDVPLIMKFELSGTRADVDKFRKRVDELNGQMVTAEQ